MTETFFGLSLLSALLTWNVYRPVRHIGWLSIPSFVFGWLVGDLALFHIAFQAIGTACFVAAGVLDRPLGQAGLVILVASWIGLALVWPLSRRGGPVAQAALDESIGPIDPAQLSATAAAGLARKMRSGRALRPFSFKEQGVRVIRDIPYANDDHPRHQLDIYLPEGDLERAPVLLQVHGGAWMIGHKREQALPLIYHMASRGWICVSTNYRLSPKYAWPAHIEDCKRAMAWVRREIEGYGGDPDFICVTGGSAGGHLSSLLALSANDPAWQPGFEDADTQFAAAVPFYGVYDWMDERGLQPNPIPDFIADRVVQKPFAGNEEIFRQASPMHRVHADAPPFFVVHGDCDSLTSFEEARAFVAKLRETSRSPVAYAEIPGAQHAFEIFHTPRTPGVLRAVERFLVQVHGQHLASTRSSDA
jgi:acetyl esterase/lipase